MHYDTYPEIPPVAMPPSALARVRSIFEWICLACFVTGLSAGYLLVSL